MEVASPPVRKHSSAGVCMSAGDHDPTPGARCPNCFWLNGVRPSRPPRRGQRGVDGRPRDSQRKRVYESEKDAFGREYWLDEGDWVTLIGVERFVASVTRSRWWRARGGPAEVEVRRGRSNQRRGKAHPERAVISLPRFTWRRWYVLHELAHLLAPRRAAWHGPEFCRVYLALLDRFGHDGEGKALRAAFDARRVRRRVRASSA